MKKIKMVFQARDRRICHHMKMQTLRLSKNDNARANTVLFWCKKRLGTLWGFPVDQSCLTASEAKAVLQRFVDIDKRYVSEIPDIANQNIERWNGMIQSIAD